MRFTPIHKYLLVLLFTLLVVPFAKAETKDQHIKIALRDIGNEILLQFGDSTSRILPIEKVDGRYAVKFEREFSFEPDLLFFSVYKTLEKKGINDSYIVESEKCDSNGVFHSFEASLKMDMDNAACKLRGFPVDCYVFYFTVIENKVIIPKVERSETSRWNYVGISLLVLVGVFALLYFNIAKKAKNFNPDLIRIGEFQFDKKGMVLLHGEQSIELSSKESDLLFLLLSNEDKTLERELILNKVWGDEGNYIGRTLDVFISKLRKKLEGDPNLKIVNVRGVGYRFVVK